MDVKTLHTHQRFFLSISLSSQLLNHYFKYIIDMLECCLTLKNLSYLHHARKQHVPFFQTIFCKHNNWTLILFVSYYLYSLKHSYYNSSILYFLKYSFCCNLWLMHLQEILMINPNHQQAIGNQIFHFVSGKFSQCV